MPGFCEQDGRSSNLMAQISAKLGIKLENFIFVAMRFFSLRPFQRMIIGLRQASI
jgi:hypothetical protein